MDAGEAVYWKLSTTSGVTDLTTNIEPGKNKQGSSLPRIVYHWISDPPLHTMGSDDGEGHPRVQVDCLASTVDGAYTLADAVEAALKDATGTFGTGGDTLEVERIFKKDKGDLPYDDVNKVATVSLDFEVWHE
jgi:hypothetical protein